MKNMNTLDEEYRLADTAEERRIMMAVITIGVVMGIVLSLIVT